MSRQTDDLARTMREHLELLVGRMTELVELSRGLQVNHCLFSGARTIETTGYVHLGFTVPMAAVAIGNMAGANGDVTAVAGSPGDSAPTEGAGVLVVPPGWHLVAPMTGIDLTVWGTAGDSVHVVALTRMVPPSAGGGGASGGTP